MDINEIEKKVEELLKYKRIIDEATEEKKRIESEIIGIMDGDKMTTLKYKLAIIHNRRETLNKAKAIAKHPDLNNPDFISVSEYDYLKVT